MHSRHAGAVAIRWSAVVSLIALMALSCSAEPVVSAPTSVPSSAPASPTQTQAPVIDGQRVESALDFGGLRRTYTLVTPSSTGPVPLIIAMHGGGGDSDQFERTSGLTEVATAAGYAVLYPNGTAGPLGIQTWNAGLCCGYAANEAIDDVGFITAVVDEVVRSYGIDGARIFATGHSNGGMMAYRLACERSDLISGIAAVAATMVFEPCRPAQPVPVLHLHSARDTNVPLGGGLGTGLAQVDYPPLDTTMQAWVAFNRCAPGPLVTESELVTHTAWSSCTGGAVELYVTADGGHAWPGGQPGSRRGDEPSMAIVANDLIVEFFDEHG